VIIALSGLAGSGKDTVADVLSMNARCERVAFADPMKQFAREVFEFSHDQLYGPSAMRNAPDPRYTRPNGEALTPRFALQTLGTEWGRNCDPSLWAKVGVRRAIELEKAGLVAVITDCRFINEAKLVREAGGLVWFVDRGLAASSTHPSETEMLSPEFQALVTVTVSNKRSLWDLAVSVRAHLRWVAP